MINEKVMDSVAVGNVRQTRENLLMIILTDRGFSSSEFDESLKHAKENLKGLFDEFDNEYKKSKWDADYWNYLYASLNDNFCQERIDLLKKVGEKVYPTVQEESYVSKVPPVKMQNSHPDTPPKLPTHMKVMGALVIAAIGCATIGITKTAVAATVIMGGVLALQKKGMR